MYRGWSILQSILPLGKYPHPIVRIRAGGVSGVLWVWCSMEEWEEWRTAEDQKDVAPGEARLSRVWRQIKVCVCTLDDMCCC